MFNQAQKIRETYELGGNQILLQGGLHPRLRLSWYEELLREMRRRFPQLNIHGFSPPELHHFTKVEKLPPLGSMLPKPGTSSRT